MPDRSSNKIRLTTIRADALSAHLCRPAEPLSSPLPEGGALDEAETSSTMSADLYPVEAHLTDEQFINYPLHTLTSTVQRHVEAHLEVCPSCSTEIERLISLSGLWNEEGQIQRLESRMLSLADPTRHARPEKRPLPTFIEGVRVLLQTLIRPQGAYAEGDEDFSSPVEFHVLEGGSIVDELQGSLQRKNDEYYVRIVTHHLEDRARFHDRRVQITLSDTGKNSPILQRSIDVGAVVLIGTGLPLTDTSHLAAELLPLAEVKGLDNDM